ncbi:MAG: lactonase family protein [Reichenbachiella sp.]
MKKFHTADSLFIIFLLIMSCVPKTNNQSLKSGIPKLELLVGAYTGSGNDGITLLNFNIEHGTLENKGLIVKTTNPSYLAISKDRNKVYAVNETENGKVSSFKWNTERTKLSLISEQSSQGDYPCYAALNNAESLLAIGNYVTGNIVSYNIDRDGVIHENPFVGQHKGKGGDPERQAGPHAHCVKFSWNKKFLYAVDLGKDEIIKYHLNGTELSNPTTAIKLQPGDGPRHLIFHPTRKFAFIINELSSTMVSLAIEKNGDLKEISRVSTITEDYEGDNACADIHISDDGKFLYGSNRGHNSIVILELAENGTLVKLNHESVRGDWPRNFTLSPDIDNRFLLVANQKSNNITVFNRDRNSGLLTFTGNEIAISQPVCLKF